MTEPTPPQSEGEESWEVISRHLKDILDEQKVFDRKRRWARFGILVVFGSILAFFELWGIEWWVKDGGDFLIFIAFWLAFYLVPAVWLWLWTARKWPMFPEFIVHIRESGESS